MFSHLPSLKETVQQFQLLAKKNLGQNFLLNMDTVRRVARCAGDLSAVTVIEVGPGPGGLTRALLEAGAHHVVAIEKDERCLGLLAELQQCAPQRLTIINDDALKIIPQDLTEGNIKIVANLPYNIGTPLLIKWLHRLDRIISLSLMFQKEVALRIVAKPDTQHYGRLSIICQYLCSVTKDFDLPPGAFTPAPKITSSVVTLTPLPFDADKQRLLPFLEKITHQAFCQRRKMLRSSLRSLFTEEDFASVSIVPTSRAEELSIADFTNLAQMLSVRNGCSTGSSLKS